MPNYDYKCQNGHVREIFLHTYKDLGCGTVICEECRATMVHVISPSSRMLWFEEGRPRVIYNLGPEPVVVRSHAEHRRLMKEAGVVEAGSLPGTKGRWM